MAKGMWRSKGGDIVVEDALKRTTVKIGVNPAKPKPKPKPKLDTNVVTLEFEIEAKEYGDPSRYFVSDYGRKIVVRYHRGARYGLWSDVIFDDPLTERTPSAADAERYFRSWWSR